MLEVFKNYAALIYNSVPKMEIGKALKMAGIISRKVETLFQKSTPRFAFRTRQGQISVNIMIR